MAAESTSLGLKKPLRSDNYTVDIVNENTQKINDYIEGIHAKIPSAASTDNKLADKAFVNSTIQTATANFRGNWQTWSQVPTDPTQYPADYSGIKKPSSNDYLVVGDASDYVGSQVLSGTWRFKYTGVWETSGKNGWIPEYQVNEQPMTQAQLNAINSGITQQKVSGYDAHILNKENPHEVTKEQLGIETPGVYRNSVSPENRVSDLKGIILMEDTGVVPEVPLGYMVGTYVSPEEVLMTAINKKKEENKNAK